MVRPLRRLIVWLVETLKQLVYHVVVCIKNSRTLLYLLFRGTKTWVYMLGRLLIFTVVLTPGWIYLLKYWLFSPYILRNIEYGKGEKNRNLLDVYLPETYNPHSSNGNGRGIRSKSGSLAPVVVFVSGGAWTIGYKLWSALVAQGLSQLGVLTIVPDYRNFPQGDIEDMMDDLSMALEWTVHNAHRFGGDKTKIVLAGQSAGAHICLTLLAHEFAKGRGLLRKKNGGSIQADTEKAPHSPLFSARLAPFSPPTAAAAAAAAVVAAATRSATAVAPTPTTAEKSSRRSFRLRVNWDDRVDQTSPRRDIIDNSSNVNDEEEEDNSYELDSELTSSAPNSVSAPASYSRPLSVRSGASADSRSLSLFDRTGQSTNFSQQSYGEGDGECECDNRRPGAGWRTVWNEGGDDDNFASHSPDTDTGVADSLASTSTTCPHSARAATGRDRAFSLEEGSSPGHDRADSAPDGSRAGLRADASSAQRSRRRYTLDNPGSDWSPSQPSRHRSISSAPSATAPHSPPQISVADILDALSREDIVSTQDRRDSARKRGDSFWPVSTSPQHSLRGPSRASPAPLVGRQFSSGDSSASPSPEKDRIAQLGSREASPGKGSAPGSPKPLDGARSVLQTSVSSSARTLGSFSKSRSEVENSESESGSESGSERGSEGGAEKGPREFFHALEHVKLFIGVSGPYDLQALRQHLHSRGLDVSLLHYVCRGDLVKYSPTLLFDSLPGGSCDIDSEIDSKEDSNGNANGHRGGVESEGGRSRGGSAPRLQLPSLAPPPLSEGFPPVALFHGSRDATIPPAISSDLAAVLRRKGLRDVTLKVYEGWSHTDAILEGPFAGDTALFTDILAAIDRFVVGPGAVLGAELGAEVEADAVAAAEAEAEEAEEAEGETEAERQSSSFFRGASRSSRGASTKSEAATTQPDESDVDENEAHAQTQAQGQAQGQAQRRGAPVAIAVVEATPCGDDKLAGRNVSGGGREKGRGKETCKGVGKGLEKGTGDRPLPEGRPIVARPFVLLARCVNPF